MSGLPASPFSWSPRVTIRSPSYKGKIPKEVLGKHTQIVLTDRSELSAGRELGVMSPTTWRLADLFAKHHFLLNGLGWGGMPLHAVRRILEQGALRSCPSRTFRPTA